MYISKLTVKYQIDCSMSYFILIWRHIPISRSHLSLPEWFTCWPLCLCLTLSLTKHQQETSPSHPNLESIYWPANLDHKQAESRAIHNNNCLNVSYMSWKLLCKRGCVFVVEEIRTRFFYDFFVSFIPFSHTKTLGDWTAVVFVNLWSSLFDWGWSKY